MPTLHSGQKSHLLHCAMLQVALQLRALLAHSRPPHCHLKGLLLVSRDHSICRGHLHCPAATLPLNGSWCWGKVSHRYWLSNNLRQEGAHL